MKNHMNLQLFAQPANHTGATGMSAEMKTYYEKRLLDQAEPLLVHDQFGDKYPIPANNGKTIEFRKYESLPKATEPLTEGVTPNAQALTVTPMTATVKQYGGWAAITDVLQLTAIDNNITQATKVLASQAGRTLDTVTREVLAGGTNVIYAPAGDTAVTSRANLTTASVLTPDLIDQAATALKAQNADAIGESYVAIVHPYVAYDLRRNSEWIDVHKYAAPENMSVLSGHPGVRPDGKRLCGRSGSTDLCKDRPDGRTHIDRKLCRKTAAASAADADSCHHGSLLHCEIGGMDLWHGVPYRSAAV